MSLPIGELAALATSLCWTTSAFFFEAATKRMGPLVMNLVRVVMALGMLTVMVVVVRGSPLPTDATRGQLGWLALSGLVGLVFGDLCLFRAYLELGVRRAMLLQTTAPIFTALLGWIFLGETPRPMAAAGTALVLIGVTWAIRERTASAGRALVAAGTGGAGGVAQVAALAGDGSPEATCATPPPAPPAAPVAPASLRGRGLASPLAGSLGLGVVLALGGALGQAGGLILSKHGMAGYHPIASNQIRMIGAVLGFALVITAVSAWGKVLAALSQRAALAYTAGGSLFGPTIGVSLALTAIAHTQAGIAASLMATSQVWMAIVTVITGRERIGIGGIGGAALAVTGVVLLVAA
jgi:drug/metabolite transporter (DMT)-like permease